MNYQPPPEPKRMTKDQRHQYNYQCLLSYLKAKGVTDADAMPF